MPAIFCTTEAAIVVLPCAVSSARRAGEPTVAVGAVTVDVDADDPDPDSEVGLLIPGFSRLRAGLHQVQQRGEPLQMPSVKSASAASIAAPTSTAVCSSASGGAGSNTGPSATLIHARRPRARTTGSGEKSRS